MADFIGTGGNDTFTGTAGNDSFDLTQGGNDSASGGDGNDSFALSVTLGFGDTIDGGAGIDTLTATINGLFIYELGSSPSDPLLSGPRVASIERVGLIGGAEDDLVELTFPTTAGYGGQSSYFDGGAGNDEFLVNFSGNGAAQPYAIVTGYDPQSPSTFTVWQLKPDGSKGDVLVQADNVEKFDIIGTSLNDHINGSNGNDTISPYYGNDIVNAGAGDDTIFMANDALDSSDRIDGGAGYDKIMINTPNSVAWLGPNTLINVEEVDTVGTGPVYLITDDTTVAAGGLLLVDATRQQPGQSFNFSGAAETDGSFEVLGSINDDIITTGAGRDTLTGGGGNDLLNGGANVDTAVFSGNRADYTFTQTSTGVWQVDGPDGSDRLYNIEYATIGGQIIRLLPGTGTAVNFANDPATYMGAIRDFDGNDLGGSTSWRLIGLADVNGDGSAEHILVNRQLGRWAEVGTETDGLTYFANNSWAGDTRVVGIYVDPLVANGTVPRGSPNDSEQRFQHDLMIDNIHGILGQGDYNHDGLQEIYFSLTDGSAYLHAYMHADGNIQYANYQSQQQVIDYLTANGVASSTWANWFPMAQAAPDMMSAMTAPGGSAGMLASGG